jgi:hypothetical protein
LADDKNVDLLRIRIKHAYHQPETKQNLRNLQALGRKRRAEIQEPHDWI